MEQRRYACDSCRRRRVRCDGSQPCSNCTRTGLQCTFGSTTSRQSATAYARSLESQVAELQRQLDTLTGTSVPSSSAAPSRPDPLEMMVSPEHDFFLHQSSGTKVYRYIAGVNLLRTMADLLSAGQPNANPLGRELFDVLEAPVALPSQAQLDWLAALLPPKDALQTLADQAMDIALVGHDFIDRLTFKSRLDAIFESPMGTTNAESRSFMALLYALLALGEQYNPKCRVGHSIDAKQNNDIPGLHYFRASRSIVYDEHERVDLDSIGAMMLHSRFLLTVSTFSDAHAALSPAISAAMHMGLHLDDASFPGAFAARELYMRRRAFGVLSTMETYLAQLLGLPRALCSASPRQVLGLRNEDLPDEGRALIARDPTSPEAETIMTQKLLRISAKIHDRQLDAPEPARANKAWITSIEEEFQDWESQLPEMPEGLPSSRVVLGQMILRLQYAGTEIIFYSPCMHHLAIDRDDPNFDGDGYRYASMCVRAATRAVLVVQTLHAHDLLSQVHWLNRYVLAWAATTLIFFVLHSRARVTIDESREAALAACQLLSTLGQTNIAAKRIYDCLAPYADMASSAQAQ